MLVPVEVLSHARRELRRSVFVGCDVLSDLYDEPVRHRATDLSPAGLWLDSDLPLEPGTDVALSFAPPGRSQPIIAVGMVRRAVLRRRRRDRMPSGMGIAFTDLSDEAYETLASSLVGMPPPLPTNRRAKPRLELLAVEDVIEIEDEVVPFQPLALGGLLTGGSRRYRWRPSLLG
jgi:hypothetical protein